MKMLSLDEQTFKRLTSVMHDIMNSRKHDVDYSEVINELIDSYQDSQAYSGENAGG